MENKNRHMKTLAIPASHEDLIAQCYRAACAAVEKNHSFAMIGRTEPLSVSLEAQKYFAELGAYAAVKEMGRLVKLSMDDERPMNPNDKKRTRELLG